MKRFLGWAQKENPDFKRRVDEGRATSREFEQELVIDPGDFRDVQSVRRKLYRFGCVVVRGFLAVEEIERFSVMAEASFVNACRLLKMLGIDDEEPVDGISDQRLRDFVRNVRMGQLNPKWFEILNDGRSIYDVLERSPGAKKAIRRLTGGDWFPGAAIVRRVSTTASQQSKTWQKPIAMHCDGPSLSRHTYSINIWVPLTDCGTTAPGLQMVPGPFRSLQEAVCHDLNRNYVDAEKQNELDRLYSSGSDRRPRFAPQFARGDVAIFHNWIMHSSYATASMSAPRTSFELRFNAPRAEDFECFGK
jgi:hypothetical protein